jgi:hypothetical protein
VEVMLTNLFVFCHFGYSNMAVIAVHSPNRYNEDTDVKKKRKDVCIPSTFLIFRYKIAILLAFIQSVYGKFVVSYVNFFQRNFCVAAFHAWLQFQLKESFMPLSVRSFINHFSFVIFS